MGVFEVSEANRRRSALRSRRMIICCGLRQASMGSRVPARPMISSICVALPARWRWRRRRKRLRRWRTDPRRFPSILRRTLRPTGTCHHANKPASHGTPESSCAKVHLSLLRSLMILSLPHRVRVRKRPLLPMGHIMWGRFWEVFSLSTGKGSWSCGNTAASRFWILRRSTGFPVLFRILLP